MKNAILLHGRPSREEYYDPQMPSMSNAHWFPWLQAQLLKNEIVAATPEVPHSFEPKWDSWTKEVERYEINEDTILVGHSCGAGFWVRYLSDHKDLNVGKVVLVAPWIDVEQEDPNHFFDFEIDGDLANRTKSLKIFHSDNDGTVMQTSIKKLQDQIKGLDVKIFHNYGHFTIESMRSTEFPELLQACLE